MLVLEVILKQTDFYGGNQSQKPRGGKWLESPAANEKAHQGPAGPGWKPQVLAVAFAECVDISGLLIRKMVKLWERNSVPHPSKHTSETTQKFPRGFGVGPFRAQAVLKFSHLGYCQEGRSARALPSLRSRSGKGSLTSPQSFTRGKGGAEIYRSRLGGPGAGDLGWYPVVRANLSV